MRPRGSRLIIATALTAMTGLFAGCEKHEIPYLETKRIDEPLTEPDVAIVIKVLESVGESERKQLVSPFLPPPSWAGDRTLPVNELVATEKEASDRQWSISYLADRLQNSMPWTHAVAEARLTREQFCALFLSIVATLARDSADSALPLETLVVQGDERLRPLMLDERPFSSLASEEQHATLYVAAWLTIRERAAQLVIVPEENVELIGRHREKLRSLLPPELFADPFHGLYPRPEDYGIPFDEGNLSDETLTWSESDAIIGHDPTDDGPVVSRRSAPTTAGW